MALPAFPVCVFLLNGQALLLPPVQRISIVSPALISLTVSLVNFAVSPRRAVL